MSYHKTDHKVTCPFTLRQLTCPQHISLYLMDSSRSNTHYLGRC